MTYLGLQGRELQPLCYSHSWKQGWEEAKSFLEIHRYVSLYSGDLILVLQCLGEQIWMVWVNHMPKLFDVDLEGSAVRELEMGSLGKFALRFLLLPELCLMLTSFYEVWWCELFSPRAAWLKASVCDSVRDSVRCWELTIMNTQPKSELE